MSRMTQPEDRIVDVVLGGPGQRAATPLWQRLAIPVLLALLVHAGLLVLGHRRGPSLEPWSAELALRVHQELSRLHVTEVVAPPAPPAELPPEPASEPEPEPQPSKPPPAAPKPEPPHTVRAREAARPSAAPAQAAEVLTAPDDAEAPVDLSDGAFVSGKAAAFVGGASAATGDPSVSTPQATTPSPAKATPSIPKITKPVQLGPQGFDCPWPARAVSQDIFQGVVTLRVLVDARGRVERVRVQEDPGHGLGDAAATCAKQTRFSPAEDDRAQAVRAWSPPIRVRFVR